MEPQRPAPDPVRTARRQALSVGVATALYGVSLGALAVANGLSVLQACATSLLIFSGGSQFALVGVLGGGGSVAAAVAASSLLGVRNALYGLQVTGFLRARGARRLLAAHWTIDESTAVGVAQGTDPARRTGFWVTGATVFVGWNLATLLGALLGDALGDPRRYGLDAAAAAAFLALLWPRLRQREAAAVAAVAALVALLLVPVVPVGLPVVAAALVALLAGLRRERAGEGA
ncbi:AzlC family ABC transporter permease [Kineococcus auxinigenes]|uniref:AzlC family ABC transporter permease n=1 Tax=unclassified Kineococcus TaxID=2621656 RepID=UPI003D7E33CC